MKNQMNNNDKLIPLSNEAQAEFDKSRISAEVVQHKCTGCNAWYETRRMSINFTETFNCDCGERISFDVPKQELRQVIIPSNEQILSIVDGDLRLDTGITVKEAIARAGLWWDKSGSKQMRQQLIRQKEPVGGSNRGAGASFVSDNEADPNFLPSAIIKGHSWAALNKREKLMITKIWHHYNIRVPDKIGGDVNAEQKMQDRNKIN